MRDVMVRNPATVSDNDTLLECLRRGRELKVAPFPVMHAQHVCGIITANEIIQRATHCSGQWQDHALTSSL